MSKNERLSDDKYTHRSITMHKFIISEVCIIILQSMSFANTDRSGTLSLDDLNASRHFSVSAKHGTKLTSIGDINVYNRLVAFVIQI